MQTDSPGEDTGDASGIKGSRGGGFWRTGSGAGTEVVLLMRILEKKWITARLQQVRRAQDEPASGRARYRSRYQIRILYRIYHHDQDKPI